MNDAIDQLARSFLQKDTLDQCTINELQQLTSRYPYFTAAQVMLAKRSLKHDSLFFKEQLQKTTLFFQNRLWLQQLLYQNGGAEVVVSETSPDENTSSESPNRNLTESIKLPDQQQSISSNEVKKAGDTLSINEEPAMDVKMTEYKTAPPDPSKSELTFEPYHTVDYFASQGIKFKEEEVPKDKFSQQLKSFTEWLKIMKRLPIEAIASTIETNTEKKVEQLAEHSIADREVLTEAMAEVWEKQGNAEKASEIYGKLSLLDPSKSAYFAAKIEALKKTN